MDFFSNIFFFKKLKKKKVSRKSSQNVFFFKKFKFLSNYTNKFDLSDFFFEKNKDFSENFFNNQTLLLDELEDLPKKNKSNLDQVDITQSEVLNSTADDKKNKNGVFSMSSQPFEFYQKFFFFNALLGQNYLKKKKIKSTRIFSYLDNSIVVTSKFNLFCEKYSFFKKKFFFSPRKVSDLKFFFLFLSNFFFFKKSAEVDHYFNKKINLVKNFSNIFFFNKSFVFFNSSVFYNIFNFLPSAFLSSVFNFFFKKINFFTYKKSTNIKPFYFFDSSLKKKIFSNLESKISNQFLFLNKFFLFFFENFFKSKVFFKIKFFKKIYNFIEKKLKLYNFYSKFNWAQSKIGKGFFLKEMLKVLWISFFIKDPKFLLNWISKTMTRIYFKNHKKFLLVFKSVVSRFFQFFVKDLSLKGFFFDIRGKVGVTGNAKKRHFSIKFGRFSHSRKSLRLNTFQNLVKTKTGVLGLSLVISF